MSQGSADPTRRNALAGGPALAAAGRAASAGGVLARGSGPEVEGHDHHVYTRAAVLEVLHASHAALAA